MGINIMKSLGSQSFLLGLGVAALTYVLAPQLQNTLRPAAVKGAQGIMTLNDKAKHMMAEGKDKLSAMMNETGEAAGKMAGVVGGTTLYEKLAAEMREEREASNKVLEELRNSILSLKDEISQMKTTTTDLPQM